MKPGLVEHKYSDESTSCSVSCIRRGLVLLQQHDDNLAVGYLAAVPCSVPAGPAEINQSTLALVPSMMGELVLPMGAHVAYVIDVAAVSACVVVCVHLRVPQVVKAATRVWTIVATLRCLGWFFLFGLKRIACSLT